MIFHMRINTTIQMIHICEKRLENKNIWIWWNLWKSPNLDRRGTFNYTCDSSVVPLLVHCISPWIPLVCIFFLPLYILTLFSIKKCFFSVDIVFCNNRPLKERQWLHTLASFFSARIYLFHLIIRFHLYFQLLVKCHPSLSTIWVRLNGILSLIFALCGSTKDQIACEFHVCDVPLMRESTLR